VKTKIYRSLTALLIALVLCAAPAVYAAPPITLSDVEYHLTKGAKILPADAAPEIVGDLGKALARFETWGLNPDKVKIGDFEFVFAVSKGSFQGSVGVHPRVYMLAKHVGTGNFQAFDVEYIKRFGTYSTAVDLMNLAKKKAD